MNPIFSFNFLTIAPGNNDYPRLNQPFIPWIVRIPTALSLHSRYIYIYNYIYTYSCVCVYTYVHYIPITCIIPFYSYKIFKSYPLQRHGTGGGCVSLHSSRWAKTVGRLIGVFFLFLVWYINLAAWPCFSIKYVLVISGYLGGRAFGRQV